MNNKSVSPYENANKPTTLQKLLQTLEESEVQLSLNGDNLKIACAKGRVDDQLIAEIKSVKSQLVTYLRRASTHRKLPASFAQQRLWYASELSGNGSYHLGELLFLDGSLDIDALSKAFDEVVARHAILRTRFKEEDGQLSQIVDDHSRFAFTRVALPVDETRPETLVLQWVAEEMNRQFDLNEDCLLRVNLYRYSETKHWLFINIHHIIADGWSVGLLTRELVTLYDDFRNDRPASLEPLTVQYADYALWQKEQMIAGAYEQQLQYWKEKLNDCSTLAFPTDYPRPVRQSTNGASHILELGPHLSALLKAFYREQSASPFMVLLSAFYILLQRYTQQNDIVVGTSIANRNRDELESLIGLFVNVMVTRQDLAHNPTFRELVDDVKFRLLDDYENQDAPFEKVVEACESIRDPARSPLFQIAFTVENTPSEQLRLGDLTIAPIPLKETTAKYDLTFHVQEREKGFVVEIEYCVDLFKASTIKCLADAYHHLLSSALAKPDRSINALPLMSEQQAQEICSVMRGPDVPLPDKSIVQLFEQCAQESPLSTALVAPDQAPVELWPSISEFYVYDDLLYYAMTSDEKRNRSYRKAIDKLVPGKTVLEIGTGPDVILSRFAVEAGARHVYAIELLKETYDKAQETIARLGLQEKITLIHGDATKIELPEKVDVILSEIVGSIGGSEGCAVIQNQTRRFLNEGGQVIPNRSLTKMTPIALPDDFFEQPGFSDTSAPYVNKVFDELGYAFDLRLCIRNMQYSDLVANVEPFEDLLFSDFAKEQDAHDVYFVFERDCGVDGFLLWLNLETISGEWIDALANEHCWLPVYVPVFAEKINVARGDRLFGTVERRLCENRINPTFSIRGRLERAGDDPIDFDVSLDHFTREFRGSSFYQKLFPNGQARLADGTCSSLTYAQLNDRANQLARYLRANNIGTGNRVGICLNKSWQSTTAALAVLKTGATYVPVDPDYPLQRIHFIVDNADLDVLVSAKNLSAIWQNLSVPVIDVVAQSPAIDQCSKENLSVAIAPSDVAYVIYTSGSTGQPKGVMVEHRSALNLQQAQRRQFAVTADDRVLQFAAQAFDAAVSEWLMTLLSGATLVVPPSGVTADVERLARFISQHQVSLATLPPVVLRALDPETVPCLSKVISAGEACTKEIADRWAAERTLFNAYGPTENAVCSTIYLCSSNEPRDPPIGGIIDNQQGYILDSNGNLLPPGVPGELHMAGVGLAKGYLHNPQLTEKVFLRYPWCDTRLYKTGDLVRLDDDGNLHYLGRRDSQVKIRGYRIELGEVEFHLRSLPTVREAICLVKESNDHKQLCAFLITDGGNTEADLHGLLATRVPAYMVPARLVLLEQFPTTPNGKVDKAALLAMIAGVDERTDRVRPRNEQEALFSRWFAEVLDVTDVGITDSFFDLGGDSILAVQLVSKCRQAGFSLRVSDVFERRTPGELAQLSLQRLGGVETQQGLQSGELPLTPIQQWFFRQDYPLQHHWNQSVLLSLEKSISPQRLQFALSEIVRHHDALRMHYIDGADGELPRQRYQNHLTIEPVVLDLRHLSTEEEVAHAIEEAGQTHQTGFDLQSGELFKALLCLTPDTHTSNRLGLICHHLVVDIHSWRVLLEDLQCLLSSDRNGGIKLPEKGSSFQFYAQKLSEYVNTEPCRETLAYWQMVAETLRTASPTLPQTARAGELDAQADQDSSSIKVTLDRQTSESLLGTACRTFHAQMPDLLVTALREGVRRAWGAADLCLVMESHGRQEFDDRVDVTRTVGWFTTQYPLVFTRVDEEDYAELIKQTKETLRAVPNGGFDYAVLRYMHSNPNVRRSLALEREPEILLNYVGHMERQRQHHGVLEVVDGELGKNIDPRNPPTHPLTMTAAFDDEQLALELVFDPAYLARSDVVVLAEQCRNQLQKMAEFCCAQTRTYHTPSDFPLMEISSTLVDQLDQQFPWLSDLWPLTKSQQGMFFGTLANDRSAFVEQMVVEVRGDLDTERLAHAWKEVQRANSLLTARIALVGDEPCFVIAREAYADMRFEDWSVRVASERSEEQVLYFAEQTRTAGFDLRSEPGCHLVVVALEPSRFVIVLTVSHVLMDGWSHANVVSQLLSAYQGNAISAPQFADYLRWVRKQDEVASQRYWQSVVDGVTQEGQLYELVSVPELTGASRLRTISTALASSRLQALQALARKHGLLLNGILQGLWGVLLGCYTGADRVVFGYTTSGRPESLPGAERMVGLFINSLPLVLDLDENDLWQLGEKIQRQTIEHSAHQYLSAAEIQSACGQAGALYDSLMVVENYPVDEADRLARSIGFDEIVHHPIEGGQTTSPLTVLIKPDDQLTIDLVFDSTHVDDAAMNTLLADYQHLIESVLEGQSGLHVLRDLLGPRMRPKRKVATESTAESWAMSPLEKQIHAIYCELTGRQKVGVGENFFDLGGHSLLALQLLKRVNETFSSRLSIVDLFHAKNIRSLVKRVESEISAERITSEPTTLLPLSADPQGEPVFLIAGVGGSCVSFFSLVQALSRRVSAWGLQPPQLSGAGEPEPQSVAEYAARYVAALRTHQPIGPYRLLGHSFGSFIAYEMALQLEAVGQPVSLVLLDTPAPLAGKVTMSPESSDDLRYSGIVTAAQFAGLEYAVDAQQFTAMSADERRYSVAELCRDDRMPLDAKTMEKFLDVFVNQSRMPYEPKNALRNTPITLIHARDSREFTRQSERDDVGWSELTEEGVTVCVAPGDHLSMLHQPNSAVLAKQVEHALYAVQEEGSDTPQGLEEVIYE